MSKLSNKIAFITGGTSGIGLESAKLFQAEGAQVVLIGSNDERLAAAGNALDGKALLVRADVRKVSDIERAVETTRAKFGRIDVLFANAGATTVAPLEAATEAYVAENLALNFSGTFFSIQKAAPLMPRGGSVIVTTSFLNTIGYPGLSILAATKAAARSLVRTLGAELAPRGIRVNGLSPGAIATPFYSKIGLPRPCCRRSRRASRRRSGCADSGKRSSWHARRCSWPARTRRTRPVPSWSSTAD